MGGRGKCTNYLNSFRTQRCMKMTLLVFLSFLLLVQFSALSDTADKAKKSEKTTGGNTPPKASSIKRKISLEFVHITKTGGSAIEKAGAKQGIIWGACHYMNIAEVGCSQPDLPYTSPNYQSYALTSPWHTPPKLLKYYVNNTQYPYGDTDHGDEKNEREENKNDHDVDLFAVIRNPYDRVISEYYCPWLGFQAKYRKKVKKDKDPNDPKNLNWWVKDMVTKLQTSLAEFNDRTEEERESHKDQKKGLNEDPHILAQKHYVNQAEYVYDGDKVVIKNVVHYENLSKEFAELMKKYDLEGVKLPPKDKNGTYTDKENTKRLSYRDLTPESIALINEYAKQDFDAFGYQTVDKFEDGDGYSLEAQ